MSAREIETETETDIKVKTKQKNITEGLCEEKRAATNQKETTEGIDNNNTDSSESTHVVAREQIIKHLQPSKSPSTNTTHLPTHACTHS